MTGGLSALCRFAATGRLPQPASSAEACEIVELARRQGLAPLLDAAVTAAGRGWPSEAMQALRNLHRLSLSRSVQLLDAARRVRATLAAAGLRTLPLKGIALAELVYDSPADRPMADADLLLLDDWGQAVALLERSGLLVRDRAQHAWAFFDPAAGVTLELHHGLCACPEMFPLDAEGLWARRAGAEGDERPASADLLVQLAVHAAFQHGLVLSLVQFLDFRRVLERARPDPARVLEAAAAARAEPCLLAALEAAKALVAAQVDEGLLAALRRSSPRRLLRRLERVRARPVEWLLAAPKPAALVSWRLALVGARRLELVARTLVPAPGGSLLRRTQQGLRRGLVLFQRSLV